MAAQKQDDQHEHTFSSYVKIQDVVLKTYLGRWTIGRSGERGSGISVLPARYDDDDDDDIWKKKLTNWRLAATYSNDVFCVYHRFWGQSIMINIWEYHSIIAQYSIVSFRSYGRNDGPGFRFFVYLLFWVCFFSTECEFNDIWLDLTLLMIRLCTEGKKTLW